MLMQHAGMVLGACTLALITPLAFPGHLRDVCLRAANSRALRVALIPVSLACLAAVSYLILLSFPNSADEYSCVFLAKCFLAKKLYAATDALQEFFHFTHIGEKDGKWFSLYPPGWPLLLAVGLALGAAGWVNPLLATLTLVLLYRIALQVADRRAALLACLWVGTSSFFLFNAGSYYSHTACLFMLTLFTWCFLRRWFFLAGLALGYAMMTRYLSAMAYGVPFVVYLLLQWVLSGTARKLPSRRQLPLRSGVSGRPSQPPIATKDIVWFFAGLAVFNVLQLWFQYQVTGDPFLTPIQYYREHERLGFSHDFTPWQGLSQTAFRAFFYAQWVVPGFWVFVVLAFLLPGKSDWDKLLLSAGLLCGAAYTLYFSFGGNGYGPRYFFESIGAFGIVGAKAFFTLWDKAKGTWIAYALAGFLLLGFALNVWNVGQDMRRVHVMTAERQSLYATVEKQGLSNSVVFIRDWVGKSLPLEPTDLTRNAPDRNDSVLYVRDLGERNAELMRAMPERSFYVATYDKASATPHVTPLEHPRVR